MLSLPLDFDQRETVVILTILQHQRGQISWRGQQCIQARDHSRGRAEIPCQRIRDDRQRTVVDEAAILQRPAPATGSNSGSLVGMINERGNSA